LISTADVRFAHIVAGSMAQLPYCLGGQIIWVNMQRLMFARFIRFRLSGFDCGPCALLTLRPVFVSLLSRLSRVSANRATPARDIRRGDARHFSRRCSPACYRHRIKGSPSNEAGDKESRLHCKARRGFVVVDGRGNARPSRPLRLLGLKK
jgi:hypothetical protein